ncbi:TerD family protein, partial [Streptomyces carpinensis]|uniref:TerD family protein n=1 Tax=Streptomyces carpinensis TaxID=66369 RepID=UPI001ABF88D1
APFVTVTGLDGTELVSYTLTGLDAESAVIALELYRRQGDWKVRAVGQGYAGGLAELLTDQGLPRAHDLACAVEEAVTQGLARSVCAPPPRTADADRSRQPAAPVPGGDQTNPVVPQAAPDTAPTQPAPPFDGQAAGIPAQPAPQSPYPACGPQQPPYPPRPAGAQDPTAGPQPA